MQRTTDNGPLTTAPRIEITHYPKGNLRLLYEAAPMALISEQAGGRANGHLNVQLILRPTIPHPDLSYLCDNADSSACGVRLELGRDSGRPVDILEVEGNVTAEHAAKLEKAMWQHLPEIAPLGADQFGDYQDRSEVRHSDPLALTQLLLISHLLREHSAGAQMLFAPPVAALSRLGSASEIAPTQTAHSSETNYE